MWSESLTNLRNYWLNKPRGQMYIRFAHEMNGNWYAWSVPGDQAANFKTAWRRYRNLQKSIFPQSKLVFGSNGDTCPDGWPVYNLEILWLGDDQVDVYSTDWYGDHYKAAVIDGDKLDGAGGPIGLYEHQQFAARHGVPIAISEWAVNHNGGTGDDPSYIQYVYDFCQQHGGTSARNLLYECYFNYDNGPTNVSYFPIMNPDGTTYGRNPNAVSRYQQLW